MVERVLQRDERAVGVAEHGVALEAERRREVRDVPRELRQRPGRGRRRVAAALRALVDEQQAACVAEPVEVGAELRVVEAGAAVEADEREGARAALGHEQARVPHGDEVLRCHNGLVPHDTEPTLPGGWLPPVQPVPAEPAPAATPPAKTFLQRFFGPVLAALALLAKFGKVALLFVGKAKVLTTSGTMLVSIAAYTFIFGFWFAVGFVVLLFIHEMGHVIQLRREGIEASAPMFIPFLGAVVSAKSLGEDAAAEARVGLAGPVLGTLGAAACIPLYSATGDEMFKALAFTGFFLNLFNLVPITPLDGGRAMAALSPWMWFLGLFVFAVLAFTSPNPIILLILILGGMDTYRRFKAYRAGGAESREYYRVTPRTRAAVLAVYLGLIVLLVIGMDATHLVRDFSDV